SSAAAPLTGTFDAPGAIEVAPGAARLENLQIVGPTPGNPAAQSLGGPTRNRGGEAGAAMTALPGGADSSIRVSRPIAWRRTSRLSGPGLAYARPGRSA